MTDERLAEILATDTSGGKPVNLEPREYDTLTQRPGISPLTRYVSWQDGRPTLRGAPVVVHSGRRWTR